MRIVNTDNRPHDESVWETVDPDSREVALDWQGWAHILAKHRDLAVAPSVVLRVVATPHERMPGRVATEEWFYRRGAGPSGWIKVVVHYEGARGLIVTAFARRSFP